MVGSSLVLGGCRGVLDPRGRAASQTSRLAWLMFVIATLVFLLVVGILVAGALRRRGEVADERPDPHDRPGGVMTMIGVALPVVVITIVLLVSFGPLASQASTSGASLTVRITGHRWWWQVSYPDSGVVTANEIHIPAGRKVRLELTSDDVIHSFWIPELAGKRDLIPGQVNEMWIESDDVGRFGGGCAEYCGIGHTHMSAVVVADTPDEFQAWLADQARPAANPADAQLLAGQQVFLGSSCSYCHRVAGTNAQSDFGPDLTHVASRETLGAGAFLNEPDQLARWVTDPPSLKPGTLMPGVQLSDSEVADLVAYLESLH